MTEPFLILSLPRSRSAWLAHFLNYPLARPLLPVGHDILLSCDNVEQFFLSYQNGMVGTVETGAASLWQLMRREMPKCRLILVRRPLIEVFRSLQAQGLQPVLDELAAMDAMLDAATTVAGVQSVECHNLDSPLMCQWLFEYCLDQPFDFDWWAGLQAVNIQVDIKDRLDKLAQHRETFDRLQTDINRRTQCLPSPLH